MSDRDTQATEEFESNLALNMTFIKDHMNEVPQDSRRFAGSLCSYYETYNTLSNKQLYYAAKIFADLQAATEEAPDYSRGRAVKENVSGGSDFVPPRVKIEGQKLIALFDKAAETLKYPHFKFTMEDRKILTFHRTGERSRFPGAVNVWCGNGRMTADDENRLACGFNRQGQVIWAAIVFNNPEMQQLIKRIAENLVEELAINGKKYSHCCFCGLELTNAASLHAGYGPICAGNWGLPWGEVSEKTLDIGL